MNQSEFKANSCNQRQARENACERGTIGFGLVSHWLRKWRVLFHPITERRKAKANSIENCSKGTISAEAHAQKSPVETNLHTSRRGIFAFPPLQKRQTASVITKECL